MTPRSATGRRAALIVAILVVVTWGIGAQLPVGAYLGGEMTWLDRISTWWFSVMLLTLVPVGWLIRMLAPESRAVTGLATVVALLAVAGAIGNVLEDEFRIPGAEYLYGIGFLGLFFGLPVLAIALAAARRWILAALIGATFLAILVAAGHGPPLMPLIWGAFAVWVAVSRQTLRSSSR